MEEILHNIHTQRGLLWESIEDLHKELGKLDETVEHHTEAMQALMPVTHKLENGLYTREIFMPAGQLVVSFIHKQNHPSFFMEGEMSLLMDTGEVKRVKAPMTVHTGWARKGWHISTRTYGGCAYTAPTQIRLRRQRKKFTPWTSGSSRSL